MLRSYILTYESQILDILQEAKQNLAHLKNGGDIVKKGGAFGDLLNDTDIRADHVIGMYLQKEFATSLDVNVARVTVEGLDDLVTGKTGVWICVDPIDGSLNYKTRDRLIGSPYTAVVTVLAKYEQATFDDVLFSAVLDLRPKSPDLWYACRENTWLNEQIVSTSKETKLDPGSQIIMTETYYPKNREALLRIFDGQKGNYSRLGSAAYEMALVSSGNAIAFICCSQKNHELGATQRLVRSAGGVAVDWEGISIGSRPYDFRAQTPIILAANQSIADEICARVRSLGL